MATTPEGLSGWLISGAESLRELATAGLRKSVDWAPRSLATPAECSQHLAKLRRVGLVIVRPAGAQVF